MSKVKIEGNASGTGTLTIAAPNTNTDRTLTLPDGAGEILTNGSSLPAANLTGTLPAIDGSALTGLASAAGAVGFHTSTSYLTTTSQTLIPLTGYSITMTPADANSKFLLLFGGGHYSAGDFTEFSFYRGTTKLNDNKGYYGSDGTRPVNMNYLDSPATASSVTYNIYWRSWASGVESTFPWGQDGTFIVLEILG